MVSPTTASDANQRWPLHAQPENASAALDVLLLTAGNPAREVGRVRCHKRPHHKRSRHERPHPECPSGSPLSEHLGTEILKVAGCRAAHPALVTPSGVFSYHWLAGAVQRISREVERLSHFRPGDRVILAAGNSPEYVAAFYGVLLAGGVVVPVPPDIEAGRLDHIVRSCEARVMLSVPDVYVQLPLRTRMPRLLSLHSSVFADAQPGERGGGSEDDLAVLLFTSGSTGEPKGVMLSHRNLLSNAWMINEYLHIGDDERALTILPFYHAFGNSILQTHLLAGATLILAGSLTFPNSLIAAFERFGATSFSGVPDIYRQLLARSSLGRHALPALRYMTVAGGPLRPQEAQAVARRIAPAKFYVMYGQTEATARLSYLRPELLAERPGSIGKGLDGVTLQVVDEQGRHVAPGERGEIRARGANLMLGYWRDPEATARVLRDGWLYTGDGGTVDEDGFIYPQGRLNEVVKVAGFRIHPREIEETLQRRFPGIRAVVVPFALEGGGTRLALFLEASSSGEAMPFQDIRSFCRKQLPRHCVPRFIEVLNRFPLNDNLKLDRAGMAVRAEEWSRQMYSDRRPEFSAGAAGRIVFSTTESRTEPGNETSQDNGKPTTRGDH